MKRRQPPTAEPPTVLLIFDIRQWPGDSIPEKHAAWLAARAEFKRQQQLDWLEGDDVPDAPFDPRTV